MDISLRRTRSRDVASLLVLGTGLALLGVVVVGASVPEGADPGSPAGAWGGAIMAVAGYAFVLIALVRWVRRSRSLRAAVTRTPAHAGV